MSKPSLWDDDEDINISTTSKTTKVLADTRYINKNKISNLFDESDGENDESLNIIATDHNSSINNDHNKSDDKTNYKDLYELERNKCVLLQNQIDLLIKQIFSLNAIPKISISLPNVLSNDKDITASLDKDSKLRLRQRKVNQRSKQQSNEKKSSQEIISSNIIEPPTLLSEDKLLVSDVDINDEVYSISRPKNQQSSDPMWEKLANEERERKAKLRLHKQSALKKDRASLRRNMMTDKLTNQTPNININAETTNSITMGSTIVNNTDSDSDWDSDNNERNKLVENTQINYTSNENDTEIEAKVVRWARSRRDIIHLFTTVNEVYRGSLPDLGEFWTNNSVNLRDVNDIRRAYMKLVRTCHPDKHSHLSEDNVLRIEAAKVFAALNDSYNYYKSSNNIC